MALAFSRSYGTEEMLAREYPATNRWAIVGWSRWDRMAEEQMRGGRSHSPLPVSSRLVVRCEWSCGTPAVVRSVAGLKNLVWAWWVRKHPSCEIVSVDQKVRI